MASADTNKPIRFGLFDSGVGGLSVLRQFHQLASVCPSRQFEFVYLGDTARCPYGNRSAEEIQTFVTQIVGFLAGKDVDHIVMACNTSAAVGLDKARAVSPVPVHDIISPVAKYVASNFRRIGVMATQGTVNSRAYSSKILFHSPEAHVVEIACPKLVPLVEAGEIYSDAAKAALMEYTSVLEAEEVEAVILGCTHFPFMRRAISELLPASVAIIDPATLVVRQFIQDLGLDVPEEAMNETVAELYCTHRVQYFTTGSAATFAQMGSVCLGKGNASIVAPEDVYSLEVEALASSSAASIASSIEDETLEAVSNVVPITLNKSASADSKIVAP